MFPLVEELEFQDPLQVFCQVPREGALWLDSAAMSTQGRYSYIAFSPFEIRVCKKSLENPWDMLAQSLTEYTLPRLTDFPPFQGGIAGVFGYELGGYLERVPRSAKDDLAFPDLMVGYYDLVIAFDHQSERCWLFSSGFPEREVSLQLKRAKARIAYAKSLLAQAVVQPSPSNVVVDAHAIQSTFTQIDYEKMVARVIEYIRAGDIFEANVSQRFSCQLPPTLAPFDLYQRLRRNNPAPFAAYMQVEHYVLASASPECFLVLDEGQVETRPIKGTRPRYHDPKQDKANAEALVNSEKDHAENVMIVDLMRNDLSRVCEPHSVQVPQLCALESFASVHHLVSVVLGKMRPSLGAIDLLKATFPGGSITGAPKIRAMEIIAECEPILRGPYCGSVGFLGFNGAASLSITIRTYAICDHFLTFQTGGAVTIDSDPEEEYAETLAKASALHRTLTRA